MNNKLKAMYMLMLPMVLMFIIGYSLYNMLKKPIDFAWLAAIMTAMPLLMFLMKTMIFKSSPRTHKVLPVHSSAVIMGLAAALVLFAFPNIMSSGKQNFIALILAEIGFMMHMLYVFWYSALQRRPQDTLAVGKKIPNFVAYKNDIEVPSTSFKGFSTVIIFYRGNWCPFCMAQIKELAQKYRELVNSGIKIVLITPQAEKITETRAQRFNVPFIFLTDKDNQAATLLGINHNNGVPMGMGMMGYDADTVYPTVIVINKKSKIVYLDETQSFRNRPQPKTYLDILLDEQPLQMQTA